jgi:DNA helicase-2/ATP-dependent DNA helicase PcrA
MKPVPTHTIIEEELRLLARVSSSLSELSSQASGAPDFDEALLNLRDQIAEAKPEDIAALVEQMMRISAIAQRYGKGRDLPVNPESPYFAHLRLSEDEKRRDVLIGKRGFVDRRNHVQIVDWRNAPVSRIYYRYEEGDDYEERFGERTLEGVIEARRSLTIDGGRLKRIGCPQATFLSDESGRWFEAESVAPSRLAGGQGAATRVPAATVRQLGTQSGPVLRADKHLPEIAALIDPTQFDLITRPESGLCVLQGGAGSGKTTVALHRVAYLNYALPGRFRADRVLVIVLSEAMVRYVERVLPSLGVRGVAVLTAQDWLRRTRQRILPHAPAAYCDETPAAVLRFKKHPVVIALLVALTARQLASLETELAAGLGDEPDAARVVERWRELASLAPVPRCHALRDWLAAEPGLSALTLQHAQLACKRMARRLRDLLSDWNEALTDRALLAETVARECPGEFSARELEEVASWCGRQTEEGPRVSRREEMEGRIFPRALDEEDDPYLSLDGQDERPEPVAGRLDPPDDSILLHLAQLKHGGLRAHGGKPIRYEHLVIDEAQDLSALEIKVLIGCTSSLRSVTLAGDTAQRLVFDNDFSTWERLLARIGVEPTTNTTLRLGYRSTEQIMELARHVMGDALPGAELVPTRAGAGVELFCLSEQGEAVAMLAEALRSLNLREPLASTALITRYPEQARLYARALAEAEVPGVKLVANQEFSFRAGIEVTDVTQVKGLEFDYVVLLDVTAANYPDTIESRHLLYIAATRAAHQLWLLSVGAPSPVLPAALFRHPALHQEPAPDPSEEPRADAPGA